MMRFPSLAAFEGVGGAVLDGDDGVDGGVVAQLLVVALLVAAARP